MSLNEEQPEPIGTDRAPVWSLVIDHVQASYPMEEPIAQMIVADMQERDQVGRERYGVPLTAGNGRNHLIDAYQECLDFVVYLRAWLEENGVSDVNDMEQMDTHKKAMVSLIFVNQISQLPLLRQLILGPNEGDVEMARQLDLALNKAAQNV